MGYPIDLIQLCSWGHHEIDTTNSTQSLLNLRLSNTNLVHKVNCLDVYQPRQWGHHSIHSEEKLKSSMAMDRSDSITLSVSFCWASSLMAFSSFPSAAAIHSWNLKQLMRWSFVSPTTCMKEYTTVGPTPRNPLLTRSLLITSAFGVLTGTCRGYRNLLTIGLWFTKLQIYLSNEPNSSMTWHQ